MSQCLIGLGANLDNPAQAIQSAIELLHQAPFQSLSPSSLHQSEPIGPSEQSVYVNAVVVARTELSPRETLKRLQAIENQLGRKREQRWGPRQIDLDLLMHGNTVVASSAQPWLSSPPTLVLPHPWLLVRRFALEPSVEVAPDMVHPIVDESLKKIFFRTMGRVVSPSQVVVSVVGGGVDYRQKLCDQTAKRMLGGMSNVSPTAVTDPSPDASELISTVARRKAVAANRSDVVVAPFDVLEPSPAVTGIVDPQYSLYKDPNSTIAIAARQRAWPYVVLSGDLETDAQSLTMAYQSSR